MKKTIWLLLLLVICASSVLADYGDYAMSSVQDSSKVMVRDGTFADKFEAHPLAIGTFTSTNVFDVDFLVGENIILKFDEESWNVVCDNAGFVIEIYGTGGDPAKDGLVTSFRSGYFSIAGNKYKTGTAKIVADKIGSYTAVDYISCFDSDWKVNNPELVNQRISKASKINYDVREKTSSCDQPDVVLSEPYCADGNLIRDVRKSCERAVELVQDCPELCDADKCVGYATDTASKDAQAEPAGYTPPPKNVLEGSENVVDNTTAWYKQPFWIIVIGLVLLIIISVAWRYIK